MFGAKKLRQPKKITKPPVVMVETFRRSAKTPLSLIKYFSNLQEQIGFGNK